MASTKNVRIEVLNKENYDTWKIQMEALLIMNDEWEFVNGQQVKPEQPIDAVRTWENKDRKARSNLILAINPSELKRIKGCQTSNEVWTKLAAIYQSKGPARKATLLKKLTLHRMENGGDVRAHLDEFFDTIDKLSEMEISVNPDLLSIMLLYSLPPNFENFRCAIESRDELPEPEALRVKIVEESDARKKDAQDSTQNAMIAHKKTFGRGQSYANRGSGDASGRNELGASGSRNGPKKKTTFKAKCYRCHKEGHKAVDCVNEPAKPKPSARKIDEVGFHASTVESSQHETLAAGGPKSNDVWCLDSGCTSHMCRDFDEFVEIAKTNIGTLNLANDASTKIKARGVVKVAAEIDGRPKNLRLDDALHVPDLRTNLMSVGKITDHGYRVLFDKDHARILDKKGKVEVMADRTDGLYYLRKRQHDCKAIEGEADWKAMMSWHRKMGHLNFRDLRDGDRNGNVLGMKFDGSSKIPDCEVCLRGKMTRSSFPRKSTRNTELLEIIHTDVCGPMRTESNGKARYFATFIDDSSRWCEVRFLKSKDQVLQAFKEVSALLENQTGRKIKFLQSDNGTEYRCKAFDDFLAARGIGRRLTVTHTPEQNGVSERKNRTLVEMARCLLIESGLPLSLWAEAINTANYVRNRCPSGSLGGKTAFERWTGKAPDVGHLREFGSEVYTLVREPNKGKFDARSKKGVFLGYSDESKAFRVWIPEERKVDIARDVKFLEDSSGSKAEPPEDILGSVDKAESKTVEFPLRDRTEAAEKDEPSRSDSEEEDPRREEPAARGTPRRGRGRPRKEMTGLRGRPRRLFHEARSADESMEHTFLAEVPVERAVSGPASGEWLKAMAAEMRSILKKDTWNLVDRPKDRKVIGSRFVLRNKHHPDGAIERRKARIVAKGFAQRPGVDFHETFAPVARPGSIRMMAALAAQTGMTIRQLDVTTAYLNGTLEEEVFMEAPNFAEEALEEIILTERRDSDIGLKARTMLDHLEKGDGVCLLKRALYGLRQAGRRWHERLSEELHKFGLRQSSADPCVFYSGQGEDLLMIVVYVDDILAASKEEGPVLDLINQLRASFEIRDLGKANYCLGIEFEQSEGSVRMRQAGFIRDILDRFEMSGSNAVSTPLDLGSDLRKGESDKKKIEICRIANS